MTTEANNQKHRRRGSAHPLVTPVMDDICTDHKAKDGGTDATPNPSFAPNTREGSSPFLSSPSHCFPLARFL